MNTQDKLELFRESLYAISDEDFLALFEEIDAQKQEGEPTIQEYFDLINKTTTLVNDTIIFENKQGGYSIKNSAENNLFTQVNTISIAA